MNTAELDNAHIIDEFLLIVWSRTEFSEEQINNRHSVSFDNICDIG